ncbi:MAG: RES family NAD+ phosphorylase, partial [Candidatus Binatia bacterium]
PLQRRAFRDLQGRAFEAVVYRHVSSEYDALDSSGSLKAGGRWNPPGEYGVLYTALDEETVKAELERLAERQGLTLDDLAPRDLVSIEVSVSKVLDLTDNKTLEQIGVGENEIVGNDVSLCLEISRRARRAIFEAILAPSATGKGPILVIFPDRLRPTSRLQAVRKKKIL